MKKIRVFLFVIGVLWAAGFAWATPELAVDQEEFDFGSVPQGERVQHTFILSNAGDAPLVVSKVRSSCGCTVALLSSKNLEPGEQGELKASFDSVRFRGAVSKTIYLYTNDPGTPVKPLLIKGEVHELFTLAPRQVNFGVVDEARASEARVVLTNHTVEDLLIELMQTTTPALNARYEKVLPAGESREIVVTIKPKPGQERFSGYVIFKVQGEKSYDLRLPVYATIR
jgi:hypothetical protein